MGKALASYPGYSWEKWPGYVARKALGMGLHVTVRSDDIMGEGGGGGVS